MGWRGEQTPGVVNRAPNQAQGYYTGGGPLNGGQGSGMGQAVSGRGQFAAGNGITVAGQDWHPTILYLFVAIIVEMVVFGWVSNMLK